MLLGIFKRCLLHLSQISLCCLQIKYPSAPLTKQPGLEVTERNLEKSLLRISLYWMQHVQSSSLYFPTLSLPLSISLSLLLAIYISHSNSGFQNFPSCEDFPLMCHLYLSFCVCPTSDCHASSTSPLGWHYNPLLGPQGFRINPCCSYHRCHCQMHSHRRLSLSPCISHSLGRRKESSPSLLWWSIAFPTAFQCPRWYVGHV